MTKSIKSSEWLLTSLTPLSLDQDSFFMIVNKLPLTNSSIIFSSLLKAYVDFYEPVTSEDLQKLFPDSTLSPTDSFVSQVRTHSKLNKEE